LRGLRDSPTAIHVSFSFDWSPGRPHWGKVVSFAFRPLGDPLMTDLRRLRETFRAALDLPADADVDELTYAGNEKWDSLAHMSLVAAIEDEFSVMIDTDDVINLSSFVEATRILGKYGVDFDE
jgi:acyl carrier protein